MGRKGCESGIIFVTVGTDHHAFDRLLGWIERWAPTYGGEVVVQYGSGRVPRHVEAVDYLSYAKMHEHFERALAVVCAGGPGTIMGARAHGRLPIVVPRVAALGEVVDDHQGAFARVVGAEGVAVVVEDEASLVARLEEAVEDPSRFRFDPSEVPTPAGVARMGDLMEELLRQRPPRSARRRWTTRLLGDRRLPLRPREAELDRRSP